MDFTKLLAGSAVIGLIAGFWGRIKTVAWKFFNLFVQQVELIDDITATAVVGHLIKNYPRSRLYEKTYGAAYEHTQDNRYGLIPYEMFGKRDIIFWNGWFPFLFTTGKGGAPAPGQTATAGNQERSPAKITFIRRTVDVESIIKGACDERNAAAWNVDYHHKKRVRRFFIRHIPAVAAGKTGAAAAGTAGLAWYQQNHFRLLQHTIEQLGKRVTASKSPLEDLIFPQRIKDLIREILLWRNNKDWYQDRGIPWKRGWLCYGPPGTGKTALARAFAEELDMPIFVYNLSEIGKPKSSLPDKASMRPRRERRGERRRSKHTHACRSCFNAATARAPWRTRWSCVTSIRCSTASMRPRRERRGEHQAIWATAPWE